LVLQAFSGTGPTLARSAHNDVSAIGRKPTGTKQKNELSREAATAHSAMANCCCRFAAHDSFFVTLCGLPPLRGYNGQLQDLPFGTMNNSSIDPTAEN
jgi:hypothetical protein